MNLTKTKNALRRTRVHGMQDSRDGPLQMIRLTCCLSLRYRTHPLSKDACNHPIVPVEGQIDVLSEKSKQVVIDCIICTFKLVALSWNPRCIEEKKYSRNSVREVMRDAVPSNLSSSPFWHSAQEVIRDCDFCNDSGSSPGFSNSLTRSIAPQHF